jgi:hypothetical protein
MDSEASLQQQRHLANFAERVTEIEFGWGKC